MKNLLKRLPIQLSSKQIELLTVDGEEVLFGGAAGGGKTIALLVWLLEGVDIPGYNSAIFRKFQVDTKDDESALISKSAQIYPALGGKLVGFRWMFPNGSSIVMEGIANDNALLSKQGKEYHRLAFDELTHFTEAAYQFVVTTRMRKVKSLPIKCGVRASANPGGPGHEWVKDRFITKEAITVVRDLPTTEATPYGMVFWKDKDTAYVPSRAADNPALDVEDYIRRLSKNKNPVERARMMNGDWGIAPEGLIKPTWLRYYTIRDKQVDLLISRKGLDGGIVHTSETLFTYYEAEARRFLTIDTAGGMKDITKESKGKPASWTVIGVWDYKRFGNGQALLLRHIWRDRVGFTDVCNKIRELFLVWKPSRIRVEDKTMGPDLQNVLCKELPIDLIPTGTADKVSRATLLLNMMERGEVYLPREENSWRHTYESELLGWQGLEEETNDQVDVSAYAAIECSGTFGGVIKIDIDPRKLDGLDSTKPFSNEPSKFVTGKVKW